MPELFSLRIAGGSLLETSDRELREELLQKLVDQRLTGPSVQLSVDPSRLPIRELPHGTYASLFTMYEAFCKMAKEESGGRTLFYEVATLWKSCLKFHKKTVHQVCWTCSELRAKIANSTEPWVSESVANWVVIQSFSLAESCCRMGFAYCSFILISGLCLPCKSFQRTSFTLHFAVERP